VWTVTAVIMMMLCGCEECGLVDHDNSDGNDSDSNDSDYVVDPMRVWKPFRDTPVWPRRGIV
jgi:hypothetical protein